jgi:hypothetical protein
MINKENISIGGTKYFPPSYIRSVTNEDGGVLLDLQSGRCLRLSPVGGKIWDIIRQYAEGVSLEGLVNEMVKDFPDVGPDTLRRDVSQFLRDLENKALLQPNKNISHSYLNRSEGFQKEFNELMSEPSVEGGDRVSLDSFIEPQEIVDRPRLKGSFAYSLLAILALIGVDLALKIAGFPLVYRVVSRWPVRSLIARNPPPVERICASVDAACRFYIKPALCLQRSAVATCMLRSSGAPAQMVIAARVMPLQSHAWVEVGGQVVNDESKVKSFYQVLDRC